MNWQDLFLWWNAIYSLPLLFALVYLSVGVLVGSLMGGHDVQGDGHEHVSVDSGADHELGADLDHEAGVDVDQDVHVEADADVDHDVEGDADHEADAEEPGEARSASHGLGSALLAPLAFVGVGRAPLTLVIQCLLLLWGAIGLGIHSVMGPGSPGALAVSLPATFVSSVALTRGLAFTFGRVFRRGETSALYRSELVGIQGRVVFPVTTEEGTIHFRDPKGTLQRVRARSEHERLESGQEVIILGYDPQENVYMVDDAERFAHRRS